jgi:hypothetical protein
MCAFTCDDKYRLNTLMDRRYVVNLSWACGVCRIRYFGLEAGSAGRIEEGFECVTYVNCGQADQEGQMAGKDVGRKVKFKMFSVLEVF